MSDWRLLPAGRELDRAIAEALGWRIELRVERDGYTVERRNWYAFDPESALPNGRLIPYVRSDWGEDGAWKAAFSVEDDISIIPRFSEDANAALSLPLPPRTWFVIYGPSAEGDTWDVELQDIGPVFERGQADSPALAVCRAWLDWHDKQKA